MNGITLDDLWRLAYFSGKPVELQVVGGHATIHRVIHDGAIYTMPDEANQVLSKIERLRRWPR